jgi:CobQ-like glutamine amidotransferase family enzyme
MAVLARRASWRGIDLEYRTIGVGDELRPGEHDLLYVGGGQDREQALIAPDLASRGPALNGFEGCRRGRALGTYLHGPLLPRNPWLADWLLAQALAHRTGGDPPELDPLPDELETSAHQVAGERARERGGRFG